MNFNYLRDQKGFTLIEFLLTVTILSIVLLVFASFFGPRFSLYLRASEEANIHSELNILNRKIHDELVNITDIELLTSQPASFQVGYEYYYINGSNKLVKVDASGNDKVVNSNLVFNTFDLSLYKRSGDNQNYITIESEAVLKNADQEMVFNILLNNINDKDESDPNVDYVGIKYQ